jgi:hypothetical protein
MLPPHHYIVSLISWTKTKNRVGRCDHLHIIASSSSKIPGTPTISQVQSSHSKPHYRFTLKPPKTDKDQWAATTIVPEILDSFIISLDLVPKMQTQTSYFLPNILSIAQWKIKRHVQEKKSRRTSIPN